MFGLSNIAVKLGGILIAIVSFFAWFLTMKHKWKKAGKNEVYNETANDTIEKIGQGQKIDSSSDGSAFGDVLRSKDEARK